MNLVQRDAVRAGVISAFLCLAIGGVHADVFLSNHADGGQDVFRYDDSGHFLGKHLTGFSPFGLAFGPDGGLYVQQTYGNRTSRFDPVTGALNPFTSGGSMVNPHQIMFGGTGQDLWVADRVAGGAVWRFDGVTGAYEQSYFGFNIPAGIGGVTADATGAIYASSPSGVIYKNSAGTFSPLVTAGTEYWGLAMGPDGNLYAATRDGGDSRVVRYKPDGTPFGMGGSLTDPTFIDDGHLLDAVMLNFDPAGNLYVVGQLGTPQVLRYSADGTFIDTFISASHGMTAPSQIAFGSFAPPPAVPEPATWMLFGIGLALAGSSLRRWWTG